MNVNILKYKVQKKKLNSNNAKDVAFHSYTATDQIMKIYRHFFVFQSPSDFSLEISSKYIK